MALLDIRPPPSWPDWSWPSRLGRGIVERVTGPSAAVPTVRAGVRPVPVLTAIAQILPLWLAWLVVVVLGRVLCRVAQRIPPVVRLVRRLRAEGDEGARRREGACVPEGS